MPFPLTTEQRAAVEDLGGGLLVSAAAGSGKTRVLVERLLNRIEHEGLDIDRFLVITYTKAAAAELRGRIVEELAQRLAANPDSRHLRRQTTLVYQTQISTIHAFCAGLLREHGHLLDLDPDFRLCDEGEAKILMQRAMDTVLESRYDEIVPESDFAHLVDTMSAGRDDSRLVQIALDIYGKVQAHPDPSGWLSEQGRAFALEGISDVGETSWGRLLLEDAGRQGAYWLRQIERALEAMAWDEILIAAYGDSFSETLSDLKKFTAATHGTWDDAAALADVSFPRLGAARKCEDLSLQARVKAIRDACKKRMGKVSELLADSNEQLLSDMSAVLPSVCGLFALVEDFSARYTAEKRRRGLLDFADLEHLAVGLFRTETGHTDLAHLLSRRFDEVMVDEYQDTNEVQNTIFDAVSDNGRRLFMVGDVKQSIYRFRLADPTIFLKKYRDFKDYTCAKEGEPRRILLSKNFRSRHEVLEGANFLFRNLMSIPFGEMDYTEDEALYTGASYSSAEDSYAVELNALDLSEDGEENTDKNLLEARFIARRIRTLLEDGFLISNGAGGLRPVELGDMVVLLRSPNAILHHYARAFGEQNLAWEAEGGSNYFASTEVSVALSLLQILDNPRQDIPLLSVLRSPVFGFSADRLALLRSESPDTDFYGVLVQGAASGANDCAVFLQDLESLREQVADTSCHRLLWSLYDKTNLLGIFGAMGDGETRRGNLLALCECARSFEAAGHKGLFGFLSHLNRLRESGARLAGNPVVKEGGGVAILSIHKSKGLEFPVVFLAGLMRRLNRVDMQRPMLFHPRLGVGPKGLDSERMVEFQTIARRAVTRQQEAELMAEELRLLYVAVTRAREKLILTLALTGGGRDVSRLAGDASCPVEPQALLATQSVGQWVLLSVLARPDAGALREAADTSVDLTTQDCGPAWDIRWINGASLQIASKETQQVEDILAKKGLDQDMLLTQLQWVYPHTVNIEIPSKLTATQLKGRQLDDEIAQEAPKPPTPIHFGRPRFAEEQGGLTSAQRGTALHLVMQFIDFAQAVTLKGIYSELHRLVSKSIITAQQGEAVQAEKIHAFFQSTLGRTMTSSGTLHREFKFSLLVPAPNYYPEAETGETVLLQGVVDCWFETKEGITVVDFKTDRVTPDHLLQRAEEYRPQLDAYTCALEEVTGKQVWRRVLWFFYPDCAVEI